MAALAQSLELLPGISVMWTPSKLLCTQLETDFKDALLLVFKRKFYCPQRGSIPWLPSCPAFPFLHRTAGFLLHWSAAAFAASEPLTSPRQHEMGVMFPSSPLTSLSAGPWAEQRGALEGVLGSCRRTPQIAAGLGPTPSLGPGGHGVWGSQAASSASTTAQMLKLEQIRGTNLFSQQSQFSPFLSQIS